MTQFRNAIELLVTPTNMDRSLKRKVKDEFILLSNNLEKINTSFIYNLFENEKYSYQELYTFHLNKWKHYCDYIKYVLKPKYIQINHLWFSEQYKPIENN